MWKINTLWIALLAVRRTCYLIQFNTRLSRNKIQKQSPIRDAEHNARNLWCFIIQFGPSVHKRPYERTLLFLRIHARGTSRWQAASCGKKTLRCTRGFLLPHTNEPETKEFRSKWRIIVQCGRDLRVSWKPGARAYTKFRAYPSKLSHKIF